MKDPNKLLMALDQILAMREADDTRWGVMMPLTDAQAEIFRDFNKAHDELETRFLAEDRRVHEEYERAMNLSVRQPGETGPLREFQILELAGRRYLRWEEKPNE